ncbi:division/cell wall cluster transcriptional repressor MraZ [Alcanivorax sp. JB21]|uniref:division/cell wall cluster transcriptional repressor MraZ n=1 Tax=Alcanivorax limicola TaxID=2874102 RepID=UPI001CBBD876|nr:division/cell wall cluster transcriptional repressor MraZ [Alcanivorax limicola]MBZ2189653.1 division/cell wall cluster transcriptional repressor MraZ [Alcanivorax limicola]
MFSGRSALNLDAKGRLAIPTRHRDELQSSCGGRVVVTHHPYDACLALYPEQQWNDVARQVASLSDADPVVRYLKRRFLGQAVELDMDGSGRYLIPVELRELIGLEKRAMLVGQIHRFEIWSETAWQAEQAQYDQLDHAAMPESVQKLAF